MPNLEDETTAGQPHTTIVGLPRRVQVFGVKESGVALSFIIVHYRQQHSTVFHWLPDRKGSYIRL